MNLRAQERLGFKPGSTAYLTVPTAPWIFN